VRRPLLTPVLVLAAAVVAPAAAPADVDAAPVLQELYSVVRPLDAFNNQGAIDQVLGSPALGDVTGDGTPDVVIGSMDGWVRVLDAATGAEQRAVLVDPGAMIQATPTLVDVDGDPALEVVIGTVRRVVGASGVRIYDMGSNPPALLFSQASSTQTNNAGFIGSPVVGDVNGDGRLDVVAVGFDQHLHAWNLDGSYLPGFPIWTFDTAFATPALADIDGDGHKDIVVGIDMDYGQPVPPGGYLWVVRGDGSTLPGYPFRLSTEVIWSSAAVGDIDGDGDPDIVVGTGRNFGTPEGNLLYAVDARSRTHLPGWPRQLDAKSMPSPALANLDGDPQLEVISMSGSGRVYAFEHDGTPRWSTCARASWAASCPVDAAIVASPVIADVDADGTLEVVVAGEREVLVLDAAGGAIEARDGTISEPERYTWPGANAPAVGTVDGRTVVIVHLLLDNGDDRRGPGDQDAVWAWQVGAPGGARPWAQWHGDERHLGQLVVLGPGGFTDTAGHPHATNIAKVAAAGITGGYPDGSFRPNAPVTRGQMGTFLQRGYELTPGDGPTFPDVIGTTHEPGIRAVAGKGIATGGTDGRYRPAEAVTRGQMAAFIARAEGLLLTGIGPGFCDTAGHPFEREIKAVAMAGIASGGTDGCFRPNDPVTRGQMATFLVKALNL
jgi:hypothetical protein